MGSISSNKLQYTYKDECGNVVPRRSIIFGSGSLLTALFGSSKQADVHLGIRIGELKVNL